MNHVGTEVLSIQSRPLKARAHRSFVQPTITTNAPLMLCNALALNHAASLMHCDRTRFHAGSSLIKRLVLTLSPSALESTDFIWVSPVLQVPDRYFSA